MSIRNIFVTVGTTQFDDLIQTLDTPVFFKAITALGCQKLTIQKGAGPTIPSFLATQRYVL